LAIAASGGMAPFTFLWSNGDTSSSITGLAPGTYSVVVTDANGCTANESITLTQPSAISSTLTISSAISCFGANDGGLVVAASGLNPFTYLWSNGDTSSSITGLLAGTYSVSITDANGCTSSDSIFVSEPVAISPNLMVSSPISCFGANDGALGIAVSGGTSPFTYLWSNDGSNSSIAGLTPGAYSIIVTDANGCMGSDSITLSEPEELTLIFSKAYNTSSGPPYNGFASVASVGGTEPVTFAWTGPGGFASTGPIIFGIYEGTFVVTATDSNGCVKVDSIEMLFFWDAISDEFAAGISSMEIYPNPSNAVFAVSLEFDRAEEVKVEIVNMHGQVVQAIQERNVLKVDHQFHLGNMAKGIYFVQVTTSRGTAGRRVLLR
ncbi:MAG: T9SS type A sorting domain-containing protein, partial [Bacteroidia bacterium]|nr:T9SS type A sorting domain-containing protein [Bacteroidia bacterium]